MRTVYDEHVKAKREEMRDAQRSVEVLRAIVDALETRRHTLTSLSVRESNLH